MHRARRASGWVTKGESRGSNRRLCVVAVAALALAQPAGSLAVPALGSSAGAVVEHQPALGAAAAAQLHRVQAVVLVEWTCGWFVMMDG